VGIIRKYLLTGLFLFILIFQVSAQLPYIPTDCPRSMKQAYVWYFGERAGIDFRSGVAIPLTDQDSMVCYKASGGICDSSGNLLFITNGMNVYDRTFTRMTYATGLDGDLGITQPCLVVPKPGDGHIYYIFTLDLLAFKQDNTYTTKGLRYTEIDMRHRGGLGDATINVNVPLLTSATQKLTAVAHRNGKDFWVVAHRWDSDEFYAYPVTSEGIGEPVISAAGSLHGGLFADQANAYGYMKISPDGSRLALAITGINKVEFFDFNSETGSVSNAQTYTFSEPNINPYGIEFSPDGKKLYTTLLQIFGNGPPTRPSFIYQFDLNSGLSNPVVIDSVPGMRVSAMQLAPDGRIYLARTVNLVTRDDTLDVIYNPTRNGTACNYSRLMNVPGSGFSLAGRNGFYSLPNIVQSYVNIPVFTWDSCCHQDLTRFYITNQANLDSVRWQFGDGGSASGPGPVHLYQAPGAYKVTLTGYFNGSAFTDSLMVTVHPKPTVELGDTILLFTGSTIDLHAGGGFMEYLWSTQSTDSIITASTQGQYWTRVRDYNCCINSDSVYVRIFDFYTPNAFTPNGDGLNDLFRVVGKYRNIDFAMYVYDRWGGMVFESDDIDDGWDGNAGGQPAPAGVYVWTFRIKFRGEDIKTSGDIVFKGTVTLIR